jgi:hypothetical protein
MKEKLDPKKTVSTSDVREVWGQLSNAARARVFKRLDRTVAEDFFLALSSRGQAGLVLEFPEGERRSWLRLPRAVRSQTAWKIPLNVMLSMLVTVLGIVTLIRLPQP